jgi:drug/metabolite transporter (DMT)-like permease
VWAAVRHGIAAGTVALIVGLQPVLTALWISLTSRNGDPGGQAVTRMQWAGLALGLLGLALVVGRKLDIGEVDATNLALALLGLASITVGTLYQKRHLAVCDFRTASFVQLAAALLVSAPLALLESGPVRWHPEMLGALGWSVFAMTLGASSLLYLLLQRGAAMQFTSLLYLVPPCTALMAWALFGEPLTAAVLAGMMLTAVGVWLAMREAPVAGRPVRGSLP